jgi:branched-chain amino acid transport system ATP-binding protein
MTALLEAHSLDAGYGDVPVLHDVSVHVGSGEIVAVVGANGAGKTTLLSCLAGVIHPTRGTIRFKGDDIARLPAQALPGRGFALVPEGGRLFPFMTVEENLELGGYPSGVRKGRGERMLEIFEIFPVLRERRKQLAGKLSGGERQMCAIGRAIMSRPTLLALDEPSVGLSPLMVSRVFSTVKALAERENLAVLIVEQNVAEALEVAARAYILDHGRIVRHGRAAELGQDRAIQEAYLGL